MSESNTLTKLNYGKDVEQWNSSSSVLGMPCMLWMLGFRASNAKEWRSLDLPLLEQLSPRGGGLRKPGPMSWTLKYGAKALQASRGLTCASCPGRSPCVRRVSIAWSRSSDTAFSRVSCLRSAFSVSWSLAATCGNKCPSVCGQHWSSGTRLPSA